MPILVIFIICIQYSIHIVHDEIKDKTFELELSWVGEMTNGKHEVVPEAIAQEAFKFGKVISHFNQMHFCYTSLFFI